VYFSSDIGKRKPDAEIFEFVLNENKLDPAKTLFIDDTEQHILGAKKLGIQTYHLGKEEGICDILK
jgi:putative hydrolase of the HAD superfamily